MSKKLQQSFQIIALAASTMVLGGPTIAQASLEDIKKTCNEQNPNQPFLDCAKKNNCGNDKSCEQKCNTLPEVQRINVGYDACVKRGQNK